MNLNLAILIFIYVFFGVASFACLCAFSPLLGFAVAFGFISYEARSEARREAKLAKAERTAKAID